MIKLCLANALGERGNGGLSSLYLASRLPGLRRVSAVMRSAQAAGVRASTTIHFSLRSHALSHTGHRHSQRSAYRKRRTVHP
jgi:hypothetical protein